mgnify:CR=1 FL=1|tara:strand:- start:477 stop:1295 length:819 start_codon:yes stop_codon:yes gene_type:complete
MPRYAQKIWTLPDGSRLSLPGSAIFDTPAVNSNIDIYDVDLAANQKFPISTKLEIDDRIYRYAEFGGTTAAGDLVQAEASDDAHDNLTPGTDGSVDGVAASMAAGSKVINISDTITLVANEYAGGSLIVEDNTGAGYAYQIESHDAPASDALVVIKHGLAVAIAAEAELKLIKNPWKEVIQQPTTVTGMCVGVGLAVGADGSFGWVQTRGPAAVLTSGTVVNGQHVRVAGATTAGAVIALDRDGAAEDEQAVGVVMDLGATTEWSLVYLQIE